MEFAELLSVTIRVIERETARTGGISASTHLTRDLNLDSLQVMQLVSALEDEFRVVVPLEKLPEIGTVGEAVELLAKLIG